MDKGNNSFVSSQGPDHKNNKTGEKKPWSTKRKIITAQKHGRKPRHLTKKPTSFGKNIQPYIQFLASSHFTKKFTRYYR